MSSTQQNNELIFIDPSVLQYEDLIPNLAPTLPVTYVSALGNNLQSLANTLVNHQAIAVLHLVVDSSNPLGVLGLTSSTLHEYSATLQQIKAHFAPNAEIALYSNQLTNNEALTSLITQLSDALGVTISLPSVTSLGVSLAGDWDTQTHQLDSVLPYQVTDKLTAKQAKSSGAAAVTTAASYTIPNSSSTQLTFTSTTTTTLATTGLTTSTTTSTSSSTDDYPNDDVSTSGIVVLGKSSKGEIEFANDTDWFSVTLEASKVYSFNLTGSATTETTALSIPKLLLNDATGSLLNTGTVASGTASITKFTAPSAGKYYLVASASDTTAMGSYSLSALEVINAKPTGAVSIDSKLPKQGQLLTASNTLADTDGLGTITYVWFAGDNQVGTGSTYTTQQADVNKSITVTAQYTDKAGKAEAVSSAATRTVSNVNDLPTGAVTISSTAPKLGDTLTVSNTLADLDGLGTITYTWKAGTTTLATGSTYTVTSATINKALTVTASYTDGFNKAESVSSAATQVVTSANNAPTGTVTVSNLSPKQGDTLTASSTLADKDGMGEIFYSWQANGSAVSNGAQFSKTYTVTQNDVGKQITFIAAYKDSLGNNEAVISTATKAVANVNDAPTGTVTIDNVTPKLGDTLTVSDTLADVDGLGAITYTWKAGSSTVGTGESYTVGKTDLDKTLTVTARYTDGFGKAEAVSSPSTSAVFAVNNLPTGSVSIDNKAPKQGQTVTASSSLADKDGLGELSYTWQANGIEVGTGTRYTTTQDDVGAQLTVSARYTDDLGTEEAVTSAATKAVANVNDAPTGTVTIDNVTPKLGDTLTVSDTLADVDGLGAITYTWKAGSSTVGTGESYTVGKTDLDKTLTVTARYTDGFGKAEAVSSPSTSAVFAVNNLPTGSVTIDNKAPKQGQTVTASSSLADKDGLGELSYTWQANGIEVGTGTRYTTTQDDVGAQLTVSARYTDNLGTEEAVTSAATKAVANINDAPTGTVTIDNLAPKLGDTLTVSDMLADVDGLGAITYTWKAGSSTVGTGESYTVGKTDLDKTLTVTARYTDDFGKAEAVSSPSTSAVFAVNNLPTGSVTIDNKAPKQGQTVTASSSLADKDGLGVLSYTWQANGIEVGTGTRYTTTQDDVGAQLTVSARYTDNLGTEEAVTSAATKAVANVNDAPTGTVTIDNLAPKLGDTLTVSDTLADVDGLGAITYTWKAGSSTVGTGESYTVGKTDLDKTLTVTARYTDGFGKAEAVSSPSTSAVFAVNNLPTGSVTIDNKAPKQGQTVTASSSLADKDGLGELSYTWQANGIEVGTGTRYTTTQDDVGAQLTVSARYTDNLGTEEAVTSAATKAVANVNDAPTGTVTIDNLAPKLGNTLTVSDTLADVDGLGAITYTWKAGSSTVGTGESYTVGNADLDKTLTVTARYTDGFGKAEAVSSTSTSAVTTNITINIVSGTNASDTLIGTKNIDQISGERGNDSLFGLDGNDVLNGGLGDDKLQGDAGNDELTGGAGKDTFIFNFVDINDQILDFNPADDTIFLAANFFTSLPTNGVQSKNFITGNQAKDSNDYLFYNRTSGDMFYDADGNGSADPIQIVSLGVNLTLTYKDFSII